MSQVPSSPSGAGADTADDDDTANGADAAGADTATGRSRRLQPGFLAGAVVAVLGLAGLWYGASAAPSTDGGSGGGPAAQPPASIATATGGTTAIGDIVVRNGYIREPTSSTAAAYLAISNSGSEPDTLLSAYCGAARSATFRDLPPTVQSGQPAGSVTLAGGATLTLKPGGGQLVLTGLTGRLRPGDRVSLRLSFQRTGQVLVELPVIAVGSPAPGEPGS